MTDPALTGCHPAGEGEGAAGDWKCSQFTITITVRRERGAHLVRFLLRRDDGLPFELAGYGARAALPFSGGDAVWSYNRLAGRTIMHAEIESPVLSHTAANVGIRFQVLVDGRGVTRLALGLVSQQHQTALQGAPSQDWKEYALSVSQLDSARAIAFEDTFYVSRARASWFQIAQAYTSVVDRQRGYRPLEVPAAALEPTYDSWYWTMDRIDQGLVWDLAVRSQALGFKNYLLDAGWDTEPGEYFLWLNGSTGNYTPPTRTFPDLSGLLGRMRSQLGLRVMLWMQQYALGRRSFYYPQMADSLSYSYGLGHPEETATLCPRVLRTGQHMLSLFDRVLGDYRPDAFWFDWQEDIPAVCGAAHVHDYSSFAEGYNALQQAITERVQSANPETFIEMRWPYANLNNKSYTHLWQPIDSPDEFEIMRLRAMNLRPFSAGVVMGSDEMYWNPSVPDAEAARYMAAVVFTGVPYFGPNLLKESKSRNEMLRAWLRFYQDHRVDLTAGEFAPYGDRDRPDQLIESPRAAFVYYGNRYDGPVTLARGAGTIYIVNASSIPGVDLRVSGIRPGRYRIDISDIYLRNTRVPTFADFDAAVRLRLDVPVGSLLTLTRT